MLRRALHDRFSIETGEPGAGPFSSAVVPIREVQRRYAAWALEQLGGRRTVTAEKLGIDDETLVRLLAEERPSEYLLLSRWISCTAPPANVRLSN